MKYLKWVILALTFIVWGIIYYGAFEIFIVSQFSETSYLPLVFLLPLSLAYYFTVKHTVNYLLNKFQK